jgi:hypothetical protein
MDWLQPGTLESFGTGAALIAGMLILVRERRATQRYQEQVMADFKEMMKQTQDDHAKVLGQVLDTVKEIEAENRKFLENHMSPITRGLSDVCTGLGSVREQLASQSEILRDCAERRKPPPSAGGDRSASH